jgi:hypothetical protein
LGTLQQFMRKVEEFINQEETISALTKAKTGTPRDRSDDSKEEESSSRKKRKGKRIPKTSEKKFEPFRGKSQSQDQKWTPLNATLSTVLMEAFRWPARMRTPLEKCNNQKFCEYHDDHGHQTEDCIFLRKEIEILIRNGKLVKFLASERRNDNDSRTSPQPGRIAPPPRRALIEDERDQKEGHDRRGERERRSERGAGRGDQSNPQNQLIVREIHTVFGGLAGGG